MLRVTKVEVDGFKSLVDFSMGFGKFTCLVGLNGSGKSTIFQFLEFLSRLASRGGFGSCREVHGWRPSHIRSTCPGSRGVVAFAVHLGDVCWRGRFDCASGACRGETLTTASGVGRFGDETYYASALARDAAAGSGGMAAKISEALRDFQAGASEAAVAWWAGPATPEVDAVRDAIERAAGIVALDDFGARIDQMAVEGVVDELVASPKQVICSTHSPLVLNYLEDDVAVESVRLVYKDAGGRTRTTPLFGIPRMRKKLEIMGPGEAMVDTDLPALIADLKEAGGVPR